MAAVLLQVHLFLVLQLHHHGLDACKVFESAAISDSQLHAQAPEAPLLPCPACHIAEHSLAEQYGLDDVVSFIPLAGDVPLPGPHHYALIQSRAVYGRDPPLS